MRYVALITQNSLNMEFALKRGTWDLLRHEKIPETHVLARLLTRNAWLFNGKVDILDIRYQQDISEFLDFGMCASHRSNGKFT